MEKDDENISKWKDRYIDEVTKIFQTKYVKEGDKVKTTNINPLVRLHYLDIRDVIGIDDIYKILFELGDRIWSIFTLTYIDSKSIDYFINSINSILEKIIKIKNILNETIDKSELTPNIIKLVDKLKRRYSHDDLRDSFNNYLNIFYKQADKLEEIIRDMVAFTNANMTHIKNNSRIVIEHRNSKHIQTGQNPYIMSDISKSIIGDWWLLFSLFINFGASVTDIYFLRRFLDKDYITNAIVYTGSSHSINYIYHLVKYHDFKITHASYSSESDLRKLNTKIKQVKSFDEYYKIEQMLYPLEFIQCSDLSQFPKNFE